MLEINGTFVVVKDCLFAVRWQGEEYDCFRTVFDDWQNPEFLEDFFEKHEADLKNGFWGEITVEQAVNQTLDEAELMEAEFFRIANQCLAGGSGTLQDDLFTPLSRGDFSIVRLKSKAYGGRRKSWLRVYAIRLDMNLYVITGGTIKLTRKMQDRSHTRLELEKLKVYSLFLKTNGIDTEVDFRDLMLYNDEEE